MATKTELAKRKIDKINKDNLTYKPMVMRQIKAWRDGIGNIIYVVKDLKSGGVKYQAKVFYSSFIFEMDFESYKALYDVIFKRKGNK